MLDMDGFIQERELRERARIHLVDALLADDRMTTRSMRAALVGMENALKIVFAAMEANRHASQRAFETATHDALMAIVKDTQSALVGAPDTEPT